MTNPTKAPSPGYKQRVIRGSIFMTLSPVAALFLGIIISVLINDYIPTDSYGIFSWFSSIFSIFVNIIPFQIYGAISRYLAVAKGSKDQDKVDNLLKTNTILSLIIVPLSGLSVLIVTPFIFNGVGIGGQYDFLDVVLLAIGVMGFTLSSFSIGPMMAFQKFERVGIIRFLTNTLGQVAVILMIVFGLGIRALLLKWFIVGILTAILFTIVFRKMWSLKGKIYSLRTLYSYSAPGILAFIFAYLFQEFLIRYIFQSFSADPLGHYEFAFRLFTFVNALTIGFYSALSSFYADAVGRGDTVALEHEVRWTMKISFFVFLPIIMGVMASSPSIFLLLFENYYRSYLYFLILLFGIFLSMFGQPPNIILNAVAKPHLVLLSSVISSIISGILMILALYYGLLFVTAEYFSTVLLLVVAAYISHRLFVSVLSGFLVKRRVGINLGIRQVLPLVAIAVGMLIPAVIIHFLRMPALLELIWVLAVCTLTYLIPIRLFGIVSRDEIQKATLFMPRRLAIPMANALIWIFVKKERNE